jgi:Domain of unknown function (DUF4340)
MKRFTLILSGVLALQFVLAFLLTMGGSDYAAFKAQQPLLAFDKDKVDQIAIDESGANSVTLKKQDGKWIIPSLAGFPANQDLVTKLVDKLAGLKKGWPVATTSEAADRYKVTEKNHERRIVLKNGDQELAELLIGTSPTYREVHARPGGDGPVYNVGMAAYDAGSRGEEWMNRDYLQIPEDKIASVSVGDVVLEHKDKDNKFVLEGLKPDEKPKETAISQLAGSASNPGFDVVEGKGKDALAKAEPADIQMTVKPKGGDPIVYRFKKEASGGAYLFTSSAHDYLFRVAEATVSPIVKAKRADLIEAKAKSSEADTKGKASGTEAKPQVSEAETKAKTGEAEPKAKPGTSETAPKANAAEAKPEPTKAEAKPAATGTDAKANSTAAAKPVPSETAKDVAKEQNKADNKEPDKDAKQDDTSQTSSNNKRAIGSGG